MKTKIILFVMLLGLPLLGMAHAAPHTKLRYFEGELLIEKTGGHEDCQRQVGKTRKAQISWQDTRKDGAGSISGWIVFAGGAPGKLAGPLPTQMTISTNYYDAHLNTPMTLSLDVANGKATGILRETPDSSGFVTTVCYWQKGKLTLAEKTGSTDVSQKLREHSARYLAHGHESRGDEYVRQNQFAEAAAAHDQAIAEVDGVLPETRVYFTSLLRYTARLYADAKDYKQAAQRYQRLMDIGVRQSDIGAEDPDLYRGWMRLATYQLLAKRTDEAMASIERAARLEGKVHDLDLDERLLRLRLTGNIYSVARQFDKAQASWQDEIKLATRLAGPDDLRTFGARAHSIQIFLAMKDNARFEADFEPLVKDISSRFGEASELARSNNELLGMHYYNTDATAKARPWLERAFRGHRAQFDSTVQAIREDEDAKNILAALLDIYIKQGLVPQDFLDQVKDGQASLDDMPFQRPQLGELNLPAFNLSPGPRDMQLKR